MRSITTGASCLLHWALCASTLVEGKSLWSSVPASHGSRNSPDKENYILKTAYPLGNGKLGAMPFGPPGSEKVVLNIDSLWSGGAFGSSDYRGGNPMTDKSGSLQSIRDEIFQNGTGDVSPLLGSGKGYGTYRAMGNLSVTLAGVSPTDYSRYKRSLDLTTGVHATSFESKGSKYSTLVFCSYPDQVCVYRISSSSALPDVSFQLENNLNGAGPVQTSCGHGFARLTGYTQAGPPLGMKYDAVARVVEAASTSRCTDKGVITVSPGRRSKSLTIVVSAETNYDQKKGNAANGYTFKGADPEQYVNRVSAKAAAKTYEQLLARHVRDYQNLQGAFVLELSDVAKSAGVETSTLISRYNSADPSGGDPYLESLLFDYSRHLLISSSRPNSLPANLQGRWSEELGPAWSADYHTNINLQMNYWAADQTGLAETSTALWSYMIDTWVPRGTETAKLLYDAPGFVVHNEVDIFGFTAMKEGAEWANYPAAAAWMMQHVFDNFDYTQDLTFLKTQGYPLIKAVAQFWLSQLQLDTFSKDGTLVVNPCNSPEQGPTTFGCTHYQQLIHQVLSSILTTAPLVSEPDTAFLSNISSTLSRLDKGLHFTSWGGIKEWKLSESFGFEKPNTHRHLSHLVGWFPGYSISSFANGYSNKTVTSAVETTLTARGNGNGADANAGWAKVWRAACWARLNHTEKAYYELRYAIDENFAPNGLSMYSGTNEPFQIDANFGFGGAVLSMLGVDLPEPYSENERKRVRTVVLGPAIPARWGNGRVKGLRLRGGRQVDFRWDGDGVVTMASVKGREKGAGKRLRVVNKLGRVLVEV
ncbi:Six-hairpin glycosidase-like protein [Apodospora peruviana]|uniref:Six-hairpin glycosidase-like protein n=1 Tax=Apodospora peruviana TaxID=516989 RepID=A0AAE0ID42_9PEZI|nr:Six-hairpin glycosidase-like protein [Apodospora peruviana]